MRHNKRQKEEEGYCILIATLLLWGFVLLFL